VRTRSTRGDVTLAALLGLVLGAPRLHADTREMAEARRRLAQGNSLYKGGRYEDALRLYLAAYELVPSPDILFNIGLAREKTLDYEKCALVFRQYLQDGTDAQLKERARERADKCRARARLHVKISSIPPGAAIQLVEANLPPSFRGRTPSTLELAPGEYLIRVELPGYLPLEQRASIDVGGRAEVDFPLEKLSTLLIEADVSGARVRLDDGAFEAAPLRRELRAGIYRVRVEKPGHRAIDREVRLEPGEQSTLMITLPPVPALRTLAIRARTSAEVTVDGRRVGGDPAAPRLAPGLHHVEVDATGHLPYRADVVVPDRDAVLEVTLARRRSPVNRAVFWSLLAASGASATGAVLYGLRALSDRDAYGERPTLMLAATGDRHALTADVLWGTAITSALAAAAYHYLTTPGRSAGEVR